MDERSTSFSYAEPSVIRGVIQSVACEALRARFLASRSAAFFKYVGCSPVG